MTVEDMQEPARCSCRTKSTTVPLAFTSRYVRKKWKVTTEGEEWRDNAILAYSGRWASKELP